MGYTIKTSLEQGTSSMQGPSGQSGTSGQAGISITVFPSAKKKNIEPVEDIPDKEWYNWIIIWIICYGIPLILLLSPLATFKQHQGKATILGFVCLVIIQIPLILRILQFLFKKKTDNNIYSVDDEKEFAKKLKQQDKNNKL